MIPAIDPGIGLKEDGPAPRVSQSGSPAFSKALKQASGAHPTEHSRTIDDARAAGDARARREYGKAADEARSAREADAARSARRSADDARAARRAGRAGRADDARRTDKSARGDEPDKPGRSDEPEQGRTADASRSDGSSQAGKPGEAKAKRQPGDEADAPQGQDGQQNAQGELQAAATQSVNAAVQPAAGDAATVAGTTDPAALSGLALKNAGAQQGQAAKGPADATPINAQIGTAAYRLGVHGNTEAELAQQQGITLPGSPQAAVQGGGVHDVKLATMQPVAMDDVAPHLERPQADARQVLHPADPNLKDAKGLSHKEQIALQTAQVRNEVLSRLAAGSGAETAGGAGTGPGAGDALRQQLQFSGLLARNAQSHTGDHTSANAPPTVPAGIGTPATSADLSQVYETPQDEAVQHRVVDRVAHEARWLIRSDRQEVTFRLSPEHLGSLHMKVQHKDGVFRVDLTVDNHAAKHLLESNLQDLRNRLVAEQGGGEFLFNVDVRQGHEQPNLYARPHDTGPGGIARADGIEPAPSPGLAGRSIGQSGLSIYV